MAPRLLIRITKQTLCPSLEREGKKGLSDLFIPRVYTKGYKHFIPPGFYDAQIDNPNY
jgi:hypothetical protein